MPDKRAEIGNADGWSIIARGLICTAACRSGDPSVLCQEDSGEFGGLQLVVETAWAALDDDARVLDR